MLIKVKDKFRCDNCTGIYKKIYKNKELSELAGEDIYYCYRCKRLINKYIYIIDNCILSKGAKN